MPHKVKAAFNISLTWGRPGDGMKKKLLLNTTTSLLLQVVTFLCGLILPRLVLGYYGSAVNGLVQSITQFLGIIAFMELGIGQVIQSSLYRPLLNRDMDAVSSILSSGEKFFRRIAYVLVIYAVALMCLYPVITDTGYDWFYTAALIGAISISSFAQYYFGIIDRLLLNADQRGYIQYTSQIAALLLNTLACVIFIPMGASIQAVKLTTSVIYLLRPVAVRLYIKKHYAVNRNIRYTGEPIEQKWNGIAQHTAAVIHENTDTIILTVFTSFEYVSIYSVYHLIIYGVRSIYFAAALGIQSAMGKLWAQQDKAALKKAFGSMEALLHFAVVFLFSCTGILMLPFVKVYTSGITDVNYLQPTFAVILALAYAAQCLRTPYNILIMAAGHYKQTQRSHIISAVLNLVISVVTVYAWGLVGVAIGTFVSMLYQTIWMAHYTFKKLLNQSPRRFWGYLASDILTAGLICLATSWIPLQANTYLAWIMMAVQVAVITLTVIAAVSMLLYRRKMLDAIGWLMKKSS